MDNMTGVVTTSVTSTRLFGQVWNNTADEITSIGVVGETTGCLGIGTTIVLDKLNL